MRYIISFVLSIGAAAAQAQVPRVITDIPPVYALTAQVMGDLGTPVLLLERGADEHDFQLRPSQMDDIASADLAIWIGPELTPWLARAWQGAKAGAVSLPLLAAQGVYTQSYTAPEKAAHKGHEGHDAHKGHDHAAHDENAHDKTSHDDHDHTGTDPHAWLDPHNAGVWLDAIAAALAAKDPSNGAIYSANAAAAKAQVAALDAELAAQLAPAQDKPFVTYHDAYGYFTAHYGLSFAGALAMGDASAAGAQHVQNVQDTIAAGAVCVFPEVQHDSGLLLQLSEGTGTKVGAALDPVGATLPPSANAYAELMRALATSLADCLSGA
jgi:zinc transport system substrate-binding protein